MKGDDNLKDNDNKALLEIDDYTMPVVVKEFMTRQYEKKTDSDGNTVVKKLPVGILPNIELFVNIGGTNYYVTGSYSGSGSAEDKISQILKRDIEV